jgi:hypothetical protein
MNLLSQTLRYIRESCQKSAKLDYTKNDDVQINEEFRLCVGLEKSPMLSLLLYK